PLELHHRQQRLQPTLNVNRDGSDDVEVRDLSPVVKLVQRVDQRQVDGRRGERRGVGGSEEHDGGGVHHTSPLTMWRSWTNGARLPGTRRGRSHPVGGRQTCSSGDQWGGRAVTKRS